MPDRALISPSWCYQARREALRLEWSGHATIEVLDHSAATWPDQPYQVVVGQAEAHENVQCTDQSPRWIRLMLLRAGS